MIEETIIKNLINVLPININDKLVELDYLVNVFGTYESFIKNKETEGCDLWIIAHFDKAEYLFNKDKVIGEWSIVGKISLFHYLNNYIKYWHKYFWDRKDLYFFTKLLQRIYITTKKTNRNVKRFKIGINISQYLLKEKEYNEKIKQLFDNKEIDNIYIYKVKT